MSRELACMGLHEAATAYAVIGFVGTQRKEVRVCEEHWKMKEIQIINPDHAILKESLGQPVPIALRYPLPDVLKNMKIVSAKVITTGNKVFPCPHCVGKEMNTHTANQHQCNICKQTGHAESIHNADVKTLAHPVFVKLEPRVHLQPVEPDPEPEPELEPEQFPKLKPSPPIQMAVFAATKPANPPKVRSHDVKDTKKSEILPQANKAKPVKTVADRKAEIEKLRKNLKGIWYKVQDPEQPDYGSDCEQDTDPNKIGKFTVVDAGVCEAPLFERFIIKELTDGHEDYLRHLRYGWSSGGPPSSILYNTILDAYKKVAYLAELNKLLESPKLYRQEMKRFTDFVKDVYGIDDHDEEGSRCDEPTNCSKCDYGECWSIEEFHKAVGDKVDLSQFLFVRMTWRDMYAQFGHSYDYRPYHTVGTKIDDFDDDCDKYCGPKKGWSELVGKVLYQYIRIDKIFPLSLRERFQKLRKPNTVLFVWPNPDNSPDDTDPDDHPNDDDPDNW